MKISIIQMNSQGDKAANIAAAKSLVANAAADNPDLIVLPEYWAVLGDGPAEFHASAEEFPDGDAYTAMAEMAREHGVTLHGGSIVEKAGNEFHNTTVVFGPDGEEKARYRKIHLFDVDVPGGVSHRESATIARGSDVVTYDVNGTKVGCGICYDIRFPELFRKLRDEGADVMVLPAAFTLMTGKDHWEVLARARAIETGSHFIAVGQIGTHADGKKACYGHSMVIDPWGHISAQVGDHVGHATAELNHEYRERVRQNVPVHNHHVL